MLLSSLSSGNFYNPIVIMHQSMVIRKQNRYASRNPYRVQQSNLSRHGNCQWRKTIQIMGLQHGWLVLAPKRARWFCASIGRECGLAFRKSVRLENPCLNTSIKVLNLLSPYRRHAQAPGAVNWTSKIFWWHSGAGKAPLSRRDRVFSG